jgi:hypothetical protein
LFTGVKVTTPVEVLTVYVPWFAIVTDVALQLGEVWPLEHSFTVVASRVTPPEVVSFVNTVFT